MEQCCRETGYVTLEESVIEYPNDEPHFLLGMDDADTPTLVVAPSWKAALIGSGPTGAPLQPQFGSPDFKAYNMNFSNLVVRALCSYDLIRLTV
jgi:hypothetical protein